jgi:hypothetical protein
MNIQTYTLDEIRNGGGFPDDVRFAIVRNDATTDKLANTLRDILNCPTWRTNYNSVALCTGQARVDKARQILAQYDAQRETRK